MRDQKEKDGEKGNCNTNEEVEIIHLNSGDCQMVLLLLLLSRSVMSDSPGPHGLQAPLSMGFSSQEYWSGSPVPSLSNGYNHCIKHFSNFSKGQAYSFQSIPQFASYINTQKHMNTPIHMPVHKYSEHHCSEEPKGENSNVHQQTKAKCPGS